MAIAMGWQRPDNVAGTAAPAIMIGSFVATGGLLFGYDTGTINGILAMQSFVARFNTGYREKPGGQLNLSPAQTAPIVAILSAGTAVGSLLSAPLADYVGRRKSILYSIVVFFFGVILQTCASTIAVLLAGRFIAGMGVGCISVVVPLYQCEMAPKWIRGTLVCAYQLSITLGLLLAAIVNVITKDIRSDAAFRVPLGLQLTWAFVLALGVLFLPETPRYLIKRGRKDDAATALSRLRRLDITHPAVMDELEEIQANHEYELTLGADTYKSIFLGSPHLGRRIFTGCGLQMLQQLTGINFIMYYGTTFFERANLNLNSFLVSVIIGVINFVSTIPGLIVVESWGRRNLLMIGSAGMGICQLIVAVFATISEGEMVSRILIGFVSAFIFFYASSWGPVAWVITAEIYPLKVRAKAMSISTTSNWLLNFGISYGSPYMVSAGNGYADLGPKVFYLWGAFSILAGIFVYVMVFETSKLSLEQIDEMYERINYAWHSKAFQPSWSFQQLRNDGFVDSGIPPTEHELQQSVTTSTEGGGSLTTIQTDDTVTGDAQSDEQKIISQMGMTNLNFSY